MNNKNGFTLVMLIVYIVVILILFGITTYKFTNADKMEYIEGETFKARISDYINQYEKNKNYNIILGNSINEMDIEKLIPEITNDDKKFLKLSNGNLVIYDLEQSDWKYQYLVDLGLSEHGVEIIDFNIDKGASATYQGITVSIDQDGIITINGTFNNKEQGLFWKVSDELTYANLYTNLKQSNNVITNGGDRIRMEVEHLGGTVSKNNNSCEFNVALRDIGQNANNIIRILDGMNKNPSDNSFSVPVVCNNYVYIYIKGLVTFNNYKMKINLLKEPTQTIKDDKNNIFNLYPGVASGTGNVTIEVLNNYDIKINGTSSIDKLYVIFLKNASLGIKNSSNLIASQITENEFIVANGKNITFEVEEISGSKKIPSDQQLNFVLRGYESSTSSPIVSYNNTNNQFNCKLGNNIRSITGKITSGDVRILGMYMTNGIVFDDYIIRPKLKINE